MIRILLLVSLLGACGPIVHAGDRAQRLYPEAYEDAGVTEE